QDNDSVFGFHRPSNSAPAAPANSKKSLRLQTRAHISPPESSFAEAARAFDLRFRNKARTDTHTAATRKHRRIPGKLLPRLWPALASKIRPVIAEPHRPRFPQ